MGLAQQTSKTSTAGVTHFDIGTYLDGQSYTPGDEISMSLRDMRGQVVFEVTAGSFIGATKKGCGNKRAWAEGGAGARYKFPDSGDVTIRAAYATAYGGPGGVNIYPEKTFRGPPAPPPPPPAPPPAPPGSGPCSDLDNSGIVDVSDLLALLAAYGTTDGGDADGDGDTDVADLLALLASFGSASCSPGDAGSATSWEITHRNSRVIDPQENRDENPWEWRNNEMDLDQCKTKCNEFSVTCSGIEFECSDGQCDCIMLRGTERTVNNAPGWTIYARIDDGWTVTHRDGSIRAPSAPR